MDRRSPKTGWFGWMVPQGVLVGQAGETLNHKRAPTNPEQPDRETTCNCDERCPSGSLQPLQPLPLIAPHTLS